LALTLCSLAALQPVNRISNIVVDGTILGGVLSLYSLEQGLQAITFLQGFAQLLNHTRLDLLILCLKDPSE
jgi:hypothetical protein